MNLRLKHTAYTAKLLIIVCAVIFTTGWKITLFEQGDDQEEVLVEKAPIIMEAYKLKKSGNSTLAIKKYKEAAKSNDNSIKQEALYELAVLEFETGKSDNYIKLLEESSKLGNINATMKLAKAYLRGSGTKIDVEKATNLYLKIYKTTPDAAIELAYIKKKIDVKGVTDSNILMSNAIIQLEKMAKKDSKNRNDSYIQLARIYKSNKITKPNLKKAEHWYRKAVDNGSVKGAIELAKLWHLTGVRKNSTVDAFKLMMQAAKATDNRESREAIEYIGNAYLTGSGTEKNPKLAAKWILKAAKSNSTSAMINISWLYKTGKGIKKDKQLSAKWLKKALLIGKDNIYSVAKQLENNSSLLSSARILNLYKIAAENGSVDAMYRMGLAYINGFGGLTISTSKSVKWLKKAADKGHLRSLVKLANAHMIGLGVSQDLTQAYSMYKKAAEQGSAEAQYQLGLGYARAFGVEKDTALAKKWLRRAKNSGHPLTEEILQSLNISG